jgi:hypothetical protein
MGWFFPAAFLVGFELIYFSIRNQTKDNSLTRKGVFTFAALMVILFIVSVGVVYFTG